MLYISLQRLLLYVFIYPRSQAPCGHFPPPTRHSKYYIVHTILYYTIQPMLIQSSSFLLFCATGTYILDTVCLIGLATLKMLEI